MTKSVAQALGQVQLPDMDASCELSALSAHIAAELAAGLSDAASIRERYGITVPQWDTLKRNPAFRGMIVEALRTFSGDLNAGARIQKKADIILEDALNEYDSLIHSKETPAQAKVDAGKFLATLAGRGQKDATGAPAGAGFVLNINVGGGREKLVIDGKNIPIVGDEH